MLSAHQTRVVEAINYSLVGSGLIEDRNLLIEVLLSSVAVSDDDIVCEIVYGCDPSHSTWVTGDNIYIIGLDMTWTNFKIDDLLVMESGVVIVNTGYANWFAVCYPTILIRFVYLPMVLAHVEQVEQVEQETPTALVYYFSHNNCVTFVNCV